MIQARVLHPGAARGPVLILTQPLSFWGAFDPRSGTIIDTHHPQCGLKISASILLLPETRGSGGTPGGIAEAIRRTTAPAGIVLIEPDINLAIGAAVAFSLYGMSCPVVTVERNDYRTLCANAALEISETGEINAA